MKPFDVIEIYINKALFTFQVLHTLPIPNMIRKLVILLLIIFFTHNPANGKQQDNEKLKFRIRWGIIPAGEVTLETGSTTKINNIPARHFILSASTFPAIDIFYKFREKIDTYVNMDTTKSLLYKKLQSGRSKRDIIVTFDWLEQKAQYSNFGIKNEPITLMPGTLDPLSALYYIRKQMLSDGKTIKRPITDGKKMVIGEVKNLGRERIELFGNSYDTYLLEPNMKDVKGVFEKSKNAKMHIWVTADENKLPVKFKSKVLIGSFVAELFEHNLGKTQYSTGESKSPHEKLRVDQQ